MGGVGCCQVNRTLISPLGKQHVLKTASSMMTLCSYQVHGNVATPKGLQHILQAYFFIVSHWLFSPQQCCHYFRRTTTHFAKLTFDVPTWFVHFFAHAAVSEGFAHNLRADF